MYGSGQADDPLVSGGTAPTSGQGSHLNKSNATGNDPISSTTEPFTEPSSTSGYGGSNTAGNDPIPSSLAPDSDTGIGSSTTSTGQYHDTTGAGQHHGTTDAGHHHGTDTTTPSVQSEIPSQAQSGSLAGLSGTRDTLDTSKPLPNEPPSGLSGISSSTTAGPHSSDLANKADPRVDSDLDGSKGLGSNIGDGDGLTGSSLPDRSVGK